MKTITERIYERFQLQADEASKQGLTKIAHNLERQLAGSSKRDTEASYVYPASEFKQDMESALWQAVVRCADYYDAPIDAESAQEVVEKYAEDFVRDLRAVARIKADVGAYEQILVGENREYTTLEVSEDDE